MAAPLECLKGKGTVFRWNEDCEVAFNQLQRSLVRHPILVYPDFSKRFKLYVDSSHLEWVLLLCKKSMAATVPSRSLARYKSVLKDTGSTKLMGLLRLNAGVWSGPRGRFNVFSTTVNHQALTWTFSENTRTTKAKLAKWAMEFSQLRFKIHHKAGTLMGHTDGLFRLNHLPTTGLTKCC
ncbi:Zinc knuckle protein [Phytophthora megakarya]|uniref:Zinc knuckle protein n=1 Tax=Phytophthora megakarya TaxID=4795 RepID=A0A225W8L0_9STRA|nr:Zinc knuckle protein [Phytophthora megakarya]